MNKILKYTSLSVLVVQTTALVLLLRYSRTMPTEKNVKYVSSTAVVMSEILKLVTCIFIIFSQCDFNVSKTASLLHLEVWSKPKETCKLAIPAVLYTVQNNLLYTALSNLDAATYQVTYQLKILTTALFSVLMLHKKLEPIQWGSLLLLMLGVTMVQVPSSESSATNSTTTSLIGLIAVLLASFSSGFSGVYFEKLIKSTPQSIWIRNVQITLFALIMSLLSVIFMNGNEVAANGFFHGYNSIAWIVVLLQAFGGLVVATVMKYADNILKGFATSVSIIISCVISYYFLGDIKPTGMFMLGSSVVIVATLLYNVQPGSSKQKADPTSS